MPEGMERLISALYEIDQKLVINKSDERKSACPEIPDIRETAISQEAVYSSCDAEEKRAEGSETVLWSEAEGRISLEYTYLYPPGIPLIVPGERISGQTVKQIGMYEKMGFEIEGTEHKGQIEVLAHE